MSMVDTIVVNVRALVSGGEGVRGLGGDLNSLRGNIITLNSGLQILQQVTQGVQQLVGTMQGWADTANKAATDLRVFDMTVAKFGVSVEEANGVAERLGEKFGMSADQVKASMTTLMRVGFTDMAQLEKTMEGAAASAVAFGKDAAMGFEKVADAAATGMSTHLNYIGVSQDLGPALRAQAKALDKTKDALTDAEKAQALYNLIVEATGTEVEALSAIQNDYVKSQQEVALAQYERNKALGEITLPLMAKYYEAMGEATKRTSEFVQAVAEGKSPLEALTEVFPSLSGPLETAAPVLKDFQASLSETAEVAEARLSPVFRAITEVLQETFERVQPIAADFAQNLLRNWNIVADGAENVLFPIFQAVLPIVEAVWREVPAVVETAALLLNGAVSTIGIAVSGVFQLISLAWENIGKPVWNVFGPVVEDTAVLVIRAIQQVGDIVNGVFAAINVAAEGDWSNAWDTFLKVASRSSDGVIEALMNLKDIALEQAGYIGKNLKDGIILGVAGLGDMLVQKLSADLDRLTESMPEWAKKALGITAAQGALNNASDYYRNTQQATTNRIIERGEWESERRTNRITGSTKDWNQQFIRGLATTFKNDPGVDSDCAIIASAILRSIGVNIESSVNAGKLEQNALKVGRRVGYGAEGASQADTGDLVTWSSNQGSRSRQFGKRSGKHSGVVLGRDENGVLWVINNPGASDTQIEPIYNVDQASFIRFAENPANNHAAQNTAYLAGEKANANAWRQQQYAAQASQPANAPAPAPTPKPSPEATGPSKEAVKDAGLTWEAWSKFGQRAFDLLDEVERATNSGSRKWRIQAEGKLAEFRKAHGDVVSFAEKERRAEEKATKEAEQRTKEAQQRLSRLNAAARSRRIEEAQQEMQAIATMRANDLRAAGDDAAARAQVERRYANIIRDGEVAIAEVRKAARNAEITNNKDYNEAERTAQRALAEKEYTNAVAAAESKRADRLAQLDKEAEARQKEIAQRRLELARAVEDGRLEAAKGADQRLLATYQVELDAAGDNVQQRLAAQEKYKEDVLAAMNAIDRADADLKKKQLKRARNAKVNTPGMSEEEREGWWAKFQRQIDAVDAALAVKLRGNAQKVEQGTQDLTDAVNDKVVQLSGSYLKLTEQVREATAAGRFDAEAQLGAAEALAELDRQAEAAGLSSSFLVDEARSMTASAIDAGEAVRGWVQELARLDGVQGSDIAAGVKLGGGGQEMVFDARTAVGQWQAGDGDLDALQGLEESLRATMQGAGPEVKALLEPLYDDVQEAIGDLVQRGVNVGLRSAAREINNQLQGLERGNERGLVDPLEYVRRRTQLMTELAENEWSARQQSADFQALTDGEREEEYKAHQDRLTRIAEGGEDDRADIFKSRQRSLQDDLLKLERGHLERRSALRQISEEEYVQQSAALARQTAGLELQRTLEDNAGNLAAQAQAWREYWSAVQQINTDEAGKLLDMNIQQERGLQDAALSVRQAALAKRKALGLASERAYLEDSEQLRKDAADATLKRALEDAKADAELEEIARQQHQATITQIEADGVQARVDLTKQEYANKQRVREASERHMQAQQAAAQRRARGGAGTGHAYGINEVEDAKELNALEQKNFEQHWQEKLSTLEEGGDKYLAAQADYQAASLEMAENHHKRLENAEEQMWARRVAIAREWGGAAGSVLNFMGNDAAAQGVGQAVEGFASGAEAYLKFSTGDIAGGIMAGVDALMNFGSAIDNLVPSIQAWKKEMSELAAEQRRAAGSLNYGGIANPFFDELNRDAAAREKKANSNFFQRLWWDITGGGPQTMKANLAKEMSEAATIFGELAGDLAGTLESEMMNAFESGGWAGAEEALNKSLDTFTAKAALQAVIQQSRLSELMKTYAEARAAGRSGKAELEAVRRELGEVQNEFREVSAEFRKAQHWDFKSGITAGMNAVFEGEDPLAALQKGLYERVKGAIVEGVMVKRYMSQIQPYLDQLGEALGAGLDPQNIVQQINARLPQLSAQMQLELSPLFTGLQSALGQNTAALNGNTAALKEAEFQQTYVTQYSSVSRGPNFRRRLGGI